MHVYYSGSDSNNITYSYKYIEYISSSFLAKKIYISWSMYIWLYNILKDAHICIPTQIGKEIHKMLGHFNASRNSMIYK